MFYSSFKLGNIAAFVALVSLLVQAAAADNDASMRSNLRKNEAPESMKLPQAQAHLPLEEKSLDEPPPIHHNRRLAECDWSGYNDWVRGWQVSCSSSTDELDYLTGIGCVIADFSGAGGACSTAWLQQQLADIGAEVASNVDVNKLIGDSITTGGLDIKAAVHTGTRCKHCVFSWLCYPRANRHKVCLAWRNHN